MLSAALLLAGPVMVKGAEKTTARDRAASNRSVRESVAPARATATDTPPRTQARGTDYSAFKLITERNIFNPRRYASSAPKERRETRRAIRVDALTLVGTMKYEKGPFAFFDGTSSSYRKVLQRGDNVGGFKVESIEGAGVKLSYGTNQIDLPVGAQLRREEEGDWHLVSAVEMAANNTTRPPSGPPPVTTITRTVTVPVTNSAPPEPQVIVLEPGFSEPNGETLMTVPPFDPGQQPPPAAAEGAGPGTEDEILRRLMERREQEINR